MSSSCLCLVGSICLPIRRFFTGGFEGVTSVEKFFAKIARAISFFACEASVGEQLCEAGSLCLWGKCKKITQSISEYVLDAERPLTRCTCRFTRERTVSVETGISASIQYTSLDLCG